MPSTADLISNIIALGGIPLPEAKHKDLVKQLQMLKKLPKVPHTPYFSEDPFTPLPDPSPRSPPRGSALSPSLCLRSPTCWKFTSELVEKKDTTRPMTGPMTPVTPRPLVLSFGAALTPATKNVLDGLDTIIDLGATPRSEIGDWKDTGIVSDEDISDVDDLLTSNQKRYRVSPDSQISRTKSAKVLDFSH